MKKLRFLQIGLGSMGKRRIRCLFFHNQKNIIGYDPRDDRREEAEKKYGIKTVGDFSKISPADFDAVLISTPPDKHGSYMRWALKHGKHFFTEVATTDDGYKEAIASKNP